MISKQRMTNHLMDIIRIDSISKKELDVALKLKKDMEDIGAECFFDNVGEIVGGNVGNLIVKLKGNKKDIQPLFLSSHMDTVGPGEGIQPNIEDGIMTSDGTTVLGSDDKSGVSIIVEVLRALKENNIPHGDIEVAFTICEEIGLLGAKHIDESLFESKYGIVLDSSTPDRLVLKCPSSDILNIKIHGVEAHAGLCPENGISAIQIASEAISKMRLGRIDSITTSNIGSIYGGLATNIIPKYIEIKAEARSHDNNLLYKQVEHMCDCFYEAAAKNEKTIDDKIVKPTVEIDINRVYNKMDVSSDSKITKLVDLAVNNLNYTIKHHTSGGGCDANYFNNKGIECVNLGTGMYELHTVNEYLLLKEFYRSAEIVLETIQLNAKLN
ncbi:MAG: M20/M25/M40 family metallo-hydrolase [Candidatus Dadabacteria bacterium]|nr:M20/M25/M40 family metallo-hydrolase [Candidatus Dadabacteria bacterium]NIQ13848.1 M20/M25/M40 family metallo-hydrolase [Candidatus Dadabacteria bacterium]